MNLQKLINLIGFSALFLLIVLMIYEAVLENSIVKIFLVLFLLLIVAAWTPAFRFFPKQMKMPKELVKAHMPYLFLIVVWSLITQIIDLVITPSVPKSFVILAISFILYIYVWYKTKGKREKVFLEMKMMKQKGNDSSVV